MKTTYVLLLATACASSHASLKHDLDLYCGPEAQSKAQSLPEIGPYLEPKLEDADFKKWWLDLREGTATPLVFRDRVSAAMASVNRERCPTLDVMTAPHPNSN